MKIEILPSAMEDLADARGFYDRQSTGLGDYFLRSLLADIDSSSDLAGLHSLYFGGHHRSLAKRFPYAVYYKVAEQTVYVYAVLDCRRDPRWIRNRLK
jgi:hypothetical protein